MKKAARGAVNAVTAGRNLREPAERQRVAAIASLTGITGNLLLALLKLFFGLASNSIALIADAMHSVSDLISSLIVLIGFTMARRCPDHEHPHGHGRAEYLAGLVLALMLVGTGIAFAAGAWGRLAGEVITVQPSTATFVALIVAILGKEFLYHFSAGLAGAIDSDTLAGDAWHHRSDTFSSLLVLAALAAATLGLPALDAYAGFAVAGLIIHGGIKLARRSVNLLLGPAPAADLQEEVLRCAGKVPGVVDAHDLEVHDYGSRKVVTIHIGVDGGLDLDRAHEIAAQVEEEIGSKLCCSAVVHLEPR